MNNIMNNIMFEQMPPHIQKEMELIEVDVKPLTKKNAIYTFISVPMMVFGIMNLFVQILTEGFSRETIFLPIIFALLAAVGVAFQKETSILRKEIQRKSNEQIIKRIENSEYITDSRKKEYISLVEGQPLLGFNTFIRFLTEEEKRKGFIHQIG